MYNGLDMKQELTKSKLHSILKKYREKNELHKKNWDDICRQAQLKSSGSTIVTPSIYQHEQHNANGYRLFQQMMEEFDKYEVFPKKIK